MTRQQLLSNASIKVVNPERREDTFPTIAKLWSAYLSKPISESDVCALMILLKAARLSAGYSSADSLVDIAGYAACAAEIWENDLNAQHDLEAIVKADADTKQKAIEDPMLKEAHKAYDLLHGLR